MCCGSRSRRAALAAATAAAAQPAASATFPSYTTPQASTIPIQTHLLLRPTKKNETLALLLLLNRTVPTTTTTTTTIIFDSAAKPKHLLKLIQIAVKLCVLCCLFDSQRENGLHVYLTNRKASAIEAEEEDIVNACVSVCACEP